MKPRTALFAVGLLTLSACSAPAEDATPGTAPTPGAAAQSSPPAFPVDVENCGRTLHFDRAPERVLSGWSTNTELLIDLGLADRLVGQYNTSSSAVRPDRATAAAAIPVLSPTAPSRETLLAAAPDLIWADGEYLFDGQQLPTIEDLAAQGVQVMILSGFCTADATRARVRDVDVDLHALGRIFGVPDRADRIRAELADQLAAVSAAATAPAVPLAMISSYDGTFYTYDGVYSDIAELAGGHNIYAGELDAGAYFGQVSTEDLTRRDPGTLVYLLNVGEDRAAASALLAAELPTVRAVRDDRVVFLDQSSSTNRAGVDAVVELAAALTAADAAG